MTPGEAHELCAADARDALRLFERIVDLSEQDRAAVLDLECASRPGLRSAVEALIDHDVSDTRDELCSRVAAARENLNRAREDQERANAPQRIGRYRILGVLGTGGMGVVYRAEQLNPRREVALKVLRAGMVTRRSLRRFEYETQALGKLHHSSIAQIYEAGTSSTESGSLPFFAMELVEGVPVDEYVRRANLDARRKIALLVRICRAVSHAHQNGVIHRDLKPGNILVTADGTPKVLDFGIARATDAEARHTAPETDVREILGTLAYMSPEQVLGDPEEFDTRSDVYALGVLGYELLSGALPYKIDTRNVVRAIQVIREVPPTPLGRHARALRGDLQTIFAKALEKERERRYPSAEVLAADLERYLSHEPILARPPSVSYQLGKFARRHVSLVVGLGIAFVALAGGLALASHEAVQANRHARVAGETNRFLREIFEAARPAHGEVLARDLLDDAAQRLALRTEEEPSVRIELTYSIGAAYSHLGRNDLALPFLEEALALRERGVEGPQEADILVYLAAAQHYAGNGERALELYERGIEMLPPEDPRSLSMQSDRGVTLLDLERFEEARAQYLELEAAGVSVDRQLASTLCSLGELEAAAAYGEKALAAALQVGETEELINTHKTLGTVRAARGEHAQAVSHFEQALELASGYYGEDSIPVAIARMDLAVDLVNGGLDTARSLELHEQMVASARATGDRARLRTTLSYRGSLLKDLGRPAEAIESLEGALAVARELDLPDDDELRMRAVYDLALCLRRVGRAPDSIAHWQAYVVWRRTHVPTVNDPGLDSALASLSVSLLQAQRFAEAIPYLRESLVLREELHGQESYAYASAASLLGQALLRTGEVEAAELWIVGRGIDTLERVAPGHGRLIEARALALEYYETTQQPEKAARFR